jgi:GLPGLI family protein
MIINMKKTIAISISCLLAALPFTGFAQQKTSGVVDYTMTMQRGPSPNGGSNVAESDNNNQNDDTGGSNVFTMNRTFTFNADGGKLSSPSFEGRRRAGRTQGQGSRQGRGFRGRSSASEFVSFADKKYIRAFKRNDNDTTFYISQDFRPAQDFQAADKTKKIAGYTCHKATAKMRNSTYTIWYTTEIPVNYSPVNGLVPPDGGFVLALQSDRMEYKATKVELQAVADSAVQVPAPSHELTETEVRSMRHRMSGGRRSRSRQAQ